MAYLQYKPTTTLFHYCGSRAFTGIIESGAIWMSDLRFANDPKELRLLSNLEHVLEQKALQTSCLPHHQAIYGALYQQIQKVRPKMGMCSFSLSLKSDQLPMWQEYTERGRGYCVGFKASAFNHMHLRVQKVAYVSPIYDNLIDAQVDQTLKPFLVSKTTAFDIPLISGELACLATSIKDQSWAHEQEVRLLFSSVARVQDIDARFLLRMGQSRNAQDLLPATPEYRERDGHSVPFHIRPFGKRSENGWIPFGAITEVIVGPNNTKSPKEVSLYLQERGYLNVKVRRSDCAFR